MKEVAIVAMVLVFGFVIYKFIKSNKKGTIGGGGSGGGSTIETEDKPNDELTELADK